MISVLQILLKILGIILLSLIGIIIVLLLLVLFVPVRYRFNGYYKEEFVCHGKVTWLLHLITFSIDFEKEFRTSIKIFGIPLSAFQKKAALKEEELADNILSEDVKKDQKPEESADTKTVQQTVETVQTNPPVQEKEADDTVEETAEQEEHLSFLKKIKHMIHDSIQKIHTIWNKLHDIVTDIRTKKETLQHYLDILRKDEVKQAFSVCKKRIWKLIKYILPKKMKVSAHLGFDDPSTTGYILAIYGMLPASVGKKIILYPDFEHSIIDCDFAVKGSVNAWSLLHQLLCIISDKNCRVLYHIVKKEILNERK